MNHTGFRKFSNGVTAYFEDISQAFFLRNALFGLLLLALFLLFDPYTFGCGVFASLVAYAYTLQYSTPKILKDSGLVTLNGFFFGIAVASLFKDSPAAYLCLLLGALSIPLATKAMFEILQHWKLSVFVFPFILSVWVVWLCGSSSSLEARYDVWPAVISTLPPLHPDGSLFQIIMSSVFLSMGRLLFLPDAVFGFALLLLVTAFSPRRGLFFLMGSFIGSFVAFSFSTGFSWEYGFFSYASGLVGLGLASLPQKVNWKTIFLFCIFSCFLTIAVDGFLRGMKLPVLSLPYVLTMWVAVLSRTPRVNLTWTQSKPAFTPAPTPVLRTRKELEEVA
jgi:urea transporter